MSETATILGKMIDRLFVDHVDQRLLAAADGGCWAKDLWEITESQGLTAALVPEARGGMGASFHDAFVIARACGQHRAPIPLPETIGAGWLLATAGLDVPAGPLALAGTRDDDLRIELTSEGWRLSGCARRVPWGRIADFAIMTVPHADGILVVRAPRAGCTVEPANNFAGEFRDTLIYCNHPVDAAPWNYISDPIALIGAMMRSGQMAGALFDILVRSVTYANDRRQFGRPIGKQQAIQQCLAVLAGEAAAVGVAAEAAFLAADHGDPEFLVAAAKVRAGAAAPQAVAIAHQVHGAIGFTLEHPLHWSTRRLTSWRTEYGSDRYWSALLGRQILNAGAEGFLNLLTAN